MNWIKLIRFISLAVLALNLTAERIFLAGQKFEAIASLFDRSKFLLLLRSHLTAQRPAPLLFGSFESYNRLEASRA
jgi:hypothetical protein